MLPNVTFYPNHFTLHIMKSKVLILIILIFYTFPVYAVEDKNAEECSVKPTEIIELPEPDFKAPIIMQSFYKLAGIKDIVGTDFAHAAKDNPSESYVVLGNFTKSDDSKLTYPFLTNMDQKGRVIWDVHENSQYPLVAVKLLKNKFGYVVLGNIHHPTKGRGFYLAQYSKIGKRIRQTPFYIPGYNAFAKSLTDTYDGKGYLVAIDRISRVGKKEATVYRVDADGFSPWDKKYPMEKSSIFENIQLTPYRDYIITGAAEQEDGRYAAWLLNLEEVNNSGWQKTYLRGVYASLHQAIPLKNGSYLVVGETQSFFGDKKSAWVMNVGANSVPIWQKFFTGEYDYNIKDIHVDQNNLISVLMDAQPFYKKGKRDDVKRKGHIRLLTLSPRGDVLYKDSFEGADNAYAIKLLRGEGTEHVILGMRQYLPPIDMLEKMSPINEGWLFFVPSFSDYVDPCTVKEKS